MVITISLNATGGFRGKVPPFVIINLKINCKTTENQLLLIIDTSSTARIAQKRVLNNHPKTWELSGVLPLWVPTMQGFALDSLGPLTPVFFRPLSTNPGSATACERGSFKAVHLPNENYTPPPKMPRKSDSAFSSIFSEIRCL